MNQQEQLTERYKQQRGGIKPSYSCWVVDDNNDAHQYVAGHWLTDANLDRNGHASLIGQNIKFLKHKTPNVLAGYDESHFCIVDHQVAWTNDTISTIRLTTGSDGVDVGTHQISNSKFEVMPKPDPLEPFSKMEIRNLEPILTTIQSPIDDDDWLY